jgi:peptidyl-prolyl cis-trans isomerase C
MNVTLVASVGGVALHREDEALSDTELRQRACTELLRQAAQRSGLLSPQDSPGDSGVISEAASEAIEALLDRELKQASPDETACRRHYAAHAADYAIGERIRLRHVLFAVTTGVDLAALRTRAERLLVELRCADPADEAFARAAAKWSNCPTGSAGGDLGWLTRQDCAEEFAREVFGATTIGVLPRLVHSRFGFHVVEIVGREEGRVPPFEAVAAAVSQTLQQQAWVGALRRYLQALATGSEIKGVSIDAS